jgi:tRNA dimethylallyltransferase
VELYRRIDERVDAMLKEGWLDEVRALLKRGLDRRAAAMSGSGYRELAAALNGELKLDEAVQRTKYSTHAFARRQYAWFRRDSDLAWIERGPGMDQRASALIEEFLLRSAVQA